MAGNKTCNQISVMAEESANNFFIGKWRRQNLKTIDISLKIIIIKMHRKVFSQHSTIFKRKWDLSWEKNFQTKKYYL